MPKNLLQNRPLIGEYLTQRPHRLSTFSFVNIYTWKDFFEFECREIDGNLCIFARHDVGCFLYLPPLGRTISPAAVEESFRVMNEANRHPGISRIENMEDEDLPLFQSQGYSAYKKCDEYIYRREDIAFLKGNAYKSQRAEYNHFSKNFHYEYVSYQVEMAKECRSLFENWAREKAQSSRDDCYRQMINDSRAVHRIILDEGQTLDVIGSVVKINGDIRAYTFGFPLDRETFCILLEVADGTIAGLPTFIFSEFCRDARIRMYSRINVMDDFGMDNIRKTKLAFHPVQIVPAYTLSKKGRL